MCNLDSIYALIVLESVAYEKCSGLGSEFGGCRLVLGAHIALPPAAVMLYPDRAAV